MPLIVNILVVKMIASVFFFLIKFFRAPCISVFALTIFIPLIISSGGNSGSQAATLVIRALAVGEVALADWWMIMKRELISGLVLGLILGAIGFVQVGVIANISETLSSHWVLIAITVSLSIIGIVIWGTLSGSMLPIILKKLGADPATSSTPLVTTMVDVTGLIIYFTVALVVLKGTIL